MPKAVLPAAGYLQVWDPDRYNHVDDPPSWFLRDRIYGVSTAYLPSEPCPEYARLASPLLILEEETPQRPLPPFYALVGTADPILGDTKRLGPAITQHGAHATIRIYEGEIHAFHLFAFRKVAIEAWKAMLDFTDEYVS
jgi:acetyl esterase/lipase